MARRFSRREFVRTGAAAGVAAAAHGTDFGHAPAVQTGKSIRPLVIASSNGNWFKNGGTKTCVEKAYGMIKRGTDVLDALIAGVNIVELDPEDDSVGYGGLPNAEGVVQLDSCCMHGPRSARAAWPRWKACARRRWWRRRSWSRPTTTCWSAQGAQAFARDSASDRGRPQHRALPQGMARVEAPDRPRSTTSTRRARRAEPTRAAPVMARGTARLRAHIYGTINCNGINAKGEICGVTTTSGLVLEDPGPGRAIRRSSAPASTWTARSAPRARPAGGRPTSTTCPRSLIVENLRRGMHPKDAGWTRCNASGRTPSRSGSGSANGDPNFNIDFYIVNARASTRAWRCMPRTRTRRAGQARRAGPCATRSPTRRARHVAGRRAPGGNAGGALNDLFR